MITKIEELPAEKQFEFYQFKNTVEKLNEQDTKTMLVEIYKHNLIREIMYKSMLNSQHFTSFVP